MKDSYAKTNNICLVFLTLVTATGTLIYTKPVLLPLIFAIFVYSILTPLVYNIQTKLKIPKALAILGAIVLLWLILTSIVLIFIMSVENFVEGMPKYKDSLVKTISFVELKLAQFHIDLELTKIRELMPKVFTYAQKFTGHLLSFLGNLFLVFIFSIFMLTGENKSSKKSRLLNEIIQKISSYISSKFFLSLATGVIVWVILLAFNIELAFIFGLLTILLNFIPTIGSIFAIALPLPIVFLQYQFSWPFFIVLILTGLVQFVIGNVIEPKIMGDSMDLHPIAVLICLIFWGLVWGIPGMFLAVPITAILKIIFARIEATQPIAEVLAGRIPTRGL